MAKMRITIKGERLAGGLAWCCVAPLVHARRPGSPGVSSTVRGLVDDGHKTYAMYQRVAV